MRSTSCCSLAASGRSALMAAQWYRWHACCEERGHEPRRPEKARAGRRTGAQDRPDEEGPARHLPLSKTYKHAVLPTAAARAAGLHYVTDTLAGIRRQRSGRRFRYSAPRGRAVRDPETLSRIRALAIPPAWKKVWICPREDGHLQATGRDARGRKQYRYHPRWREL